MRSGFVYQASVRVHLAVYAYTGRFHGLAAVCSAVDKAGRYPAAGHLAANLAAIQMIDVSSLAEQGNRCLAWMLG